MAKSRLRKYKMEIIAIAVLLLYLTIVFKAPVLRCVKLSRELVISRLEIMESNEEVNSLIKRRNLIKSNQKLK